jgi:DNA-binding transcriptional MocR family regulator
MENKYQQIIEYIKEQIIDGTLKPGNRLASIREMSNHFRCNKSTVLRAYTELEKEHLVYTVPKSGYYLIDNSRKTLSINPTEIIDFGAAAPALNTLPYEDFQHCINQAIDHYKENLFTYMNPQGLTSLRDTLVKHLQDSQVFTKAENIFITAGSQQAIHILTRIPFPNGKTNILVEQPTYYGILQSGSLNQDTVVGIPRNPEGIDLEELERIFRSGNIKFFYTIPRFHNPLGTSYPQSLKRELLALAVKYNVYIVEDDYLVDLETDSKADPIYSMDVSSRVIYLRSYSKTLMPGLRLGVAVLPQLLVNSFCEYKHSIDLSTTILSQGALEIYLKSGLYINHLKKINQLYLERMATLKTICSMYPNEIQCQVPKSGLFTCLEVPNAHSIINKLAEDNIKVISTHKNYLSQFQQTNQLRIGICKTGPEQIIQGVTKIAEAVRVQKGLISNDSNQEYEFMWI